MVSKITANLMDLVKKREARAKSTGDEKLPENASLESNIIRVKLPLSKDDTKKLGDALSKNTGGSVTYVGKNKRTGDNVFDKKLDDYSSTLVNEAKKNLYK
ncbi:MAG: hypothetical protein JSW73_03305 [Candidatus Woesearchaeota archaeon]|nr:MAG: hypothetical protein JSW73_03305 [Candidatus Woesearchaeota archaeon]